MPLIIHAKIGTMPGTYIRVKSKRKPPQIGEVIEFKELPVHSGQKWERGQVDMIKTLCKGDVLYYLARW